MRIAICIITCRRPAGLRRLLRSIAALEFPDVAPDIELVVVDNDPDGSARAVCDEPPAGCPDIRYAVEPQRGIPFARNTAVALALGTADQVAFVDDDQTVDPGWIAELVAVQARTSADVVTGPALAELPPQTPAWIAASGAFDLLRYETGSERPFAFTHNVLARREVFESVQPWFEERLAGCGGSDTHFFRRVHDAGFRIVWADDAIARERVPAGRVRVGWLLRRSLRIGGTDAFTERELGGRGAVPRLLGRAARFAGRGTLRLGAAVVRGRTGLLTAGQDWARAVGLVGGVLGYRYDEYRVAR